MTFCLYSCARHFLLSDNSIVKERTETNDLNHLIQQNILKHESSLKHVDELIERVRNQFGHSCAHSETRDGLASLKQQRDEFSVGLTEQRIKSLDNRRLDEIENAGPMGILDAVAQQLEKLVGRIEH
jgi:hypothetical protein